MYKIFLYECNIIRNEIFIKISNICYLYSINFGSFIWLFTLGNNKVRNIFLVWIVNIYILLLRNYRLVVLIKIENKCIFLIRYFI